MQSVNPNMYMKIHNILLTLCFFANCAFISATTNTSDLFSINDFEHYAKKHLDPPTWTFFSFGSEREFTLRDNLRSYNRYALIPRMLRNKAERDLSVTVLGQRMPIPIGIAPTEYQALAHPDGELGAARAAAELGTVYTMSSISSIALEDVSNGIRKNGALLWMQIYIFEDKAISEEIVKAAEANGYRALVMTVSCPVIGLRYKTKRKGMQLPANLSAPNIENARKKLNITYAHNDVFQNLPEFKDDLNWDDVTWIKSISKLPIILKGILTVEDALEAVKYGASAVWVSNHGGRQLDGVPATLDVLQGISRALEGSGCEVYVDGGVRWGSDVLKALALGARAVFIGRPIVWGLANDGQSGVRSVLEILKSELDTAMHLAGCSSISDIGSHLVKQRPI